jgi:lysophospholipase L1-like esterase
MFRKLLASLGLLLLSLCASLGLGELMVSLAAPQNLSGSWLEYGPRGVLLNRANHQARHQLDQRIVHYSFNSLHQRGKEPDTSRPHVLVLGDSFTFGWLLDEKDSFAHKLEDMAAANFEKERFQFLNGAVGGWGTADQLAYLESFGERTGPRLVLVFVSFDDGNRSLSRGLYDVDADGNLTAKDNSASRSRLKMLTERVPLYQWALEHSHLAQLLRKIVVERGNVGHVNAIPPSEARHQEKEKERRLMAALFKGISGWCDQHDAKLLVLTTGWPSVDYPWLGEEMKKLDIAFADLAPEIAPAVAKAPEVFQIANDMHPNEQGTELIAKAAWQHVKAALAATR